MAAKGSMLFEKADVSDPILFMIASMMTPKRKTRVSWSQAALRLRPSPQRRHWVGLTAEGMVTVP
jgi:hypothetical protein